MSDFRVTVLISGRGSNLKSLVSKATGYKVSAVVTDNFEAKGLEFANTKGIETKVVSPSQFTSKKDFNAALLNAVIETKPNLVCLAGFMRIIQPAFVERFYGRLINIHPSLLPAFPGLHTHQRALEAKVLTHGCTVHYVDTGVDTGPIIAQAKVPVLSGDTDESLADRVLEKEHIIYPWVVSLIAKGEISLRDREVIYSQKAESEARTLGLVLNTKI